MVKPIGPIGVAKNRRRDSSEQKKFFTPKGPKVQKEDKARAPGAEGEVGMRQVFAPPRKREGLGVPIQGYQNAGC